ncbi:MAG: O-methyltransferase [Leptospiraceae bacterium]|nr:O-methyltransferase [Leptospiraceae bacterium]MCP5495431.1 O-methyltransferase [Leptospiraceae bacterium]
MSKKGSIFIDGLESYIDVNLISRPFSIMKEVEEYAKNKQIPILSPMSGNILSYLVSITNSTNILELGTGIGYSTLWMMSTKKSLKITTIDRNQDDQKIAEQFIFKIKAPNQEIRFIHAQCLEYCKTHELDSYDFIFIDCDKIVYPELLDVLISKINPNVRLLFDNVLWHGRLMKVSEENLKPSDIAIKDFWNKIISQNIENILFPSGDGLLLIGVR